MGKSSTDLIREYLDKNIGELDRKTAWTKKDYKDILEKKNVDIVRMPGGEEIVISYTDISITGTERSKPQIRVFMDKQKQVYDFARDRQMRYFLLTLFSKDLSMARNLNHFDPHDFIVAIETNVDDESSRRDLRSLYDYLDSYMKAHGDADYVRCTKGQHQSGIYQASFIRIRKEGQDTPETLKEYLIYFDNRPYMSSRSEETFEKMEREAIDFPHNRIVFGAPGTGKSYRLKEDSCLFEKRMERVTFHPNYSYAQFVGTYKPVQGEDNGEIRYEYVPGPFIRIYTKALQHPEDNYLLLIEEINRANTAAVFGDTFQLLDRKDGVSEYEVAVGEDLRSYLLRQLCGDKRWEECSDLERARCSFLSLPNNLYLWATMNSADQGVYPMDTAFKRRWDFEYIGVNDREQVEAAGDYYIPMCIRDEDRYYVRWQDLRDGINQILSGDDCKVNEDKLLGPFFLSKGVLEKINEVMALRESWMQDGREVEEADKTSVRTAERKFIKAFESKVIMYLFEDVMKMRPSRIFVNHSGRMIFSEVCRSFEEMGEKIFGIHLKQSLQEK